MSVRILAIDTALSACSVCVYDEGAAEPLVSEVVSMERGHAERLVPLLQKLLKAIDGGLSSVNKVAVSVGPGSFTGLRVGLSAARAIGVATGLPVVGVSTLSAYAAPHIIGGTTLSIASLIDARHGNAYCQFVSASGHPLIEPDRMALEDIARALGSGGVKVIGPGAALLTPYADLLGPQVFIEPSPDAPDIVWVARLGLAADVALSPPEPLYLRGADAKPQDHARIARL
jgi:tRNA threonylcarbamoyladenosine biosynthesis protein TsaB